MRLLFFYLLHPDVRHHVAERMEGATGRQRIPADVLLDLPFPKFDPEEQTTVSDTLEMIQQLMAVETQSIETTQTLKRAAMQTLFTRGLRGEGQKETEIGPVPESWELSTLGESTQLERGRFMHRPRNEPRFTAERHHLSRLETSSSLAVAYVTLPKHFNEHGVAISRVFPAGTILITIAANIGFTGVLCFDSACPDSLVAITPERLVTSEFLEYYLQTQQYEMDRLAPKGTQKNINIQFLRPWPIVAPAVDEQREIVAILGGIDRKIDLHRRRRAVLEELFQGAASQADDWGDTGGGAGASRDDRRVCVKFKSAVIEDFKRFTNLEIQGIPETARLIMLAGPNGCGKSSFFDALHVWGESRNDRGLNWDAEYHAKGYSQEAGHANWNNQVQIEFHDYVPNDARNNRKTFYIRSAYRK